MRNCPYCNNPINDNDTHCRYCGNMVQNYDNNPYNGYGANNSGNGYGGYNANQGYGSNNSYNGYGGNNPYNGYGGYNPNWDGNPNPGKKSSNLWIYCLVGFVVAAIISGVIIFLVRQNNSLSTDTEASSERLKEAHINAKRQELEAEKVEGQKIEEQQRIEESFKKAQLSASDFLTTSTGGITWPLKSASTLKSNLKSKGFEKVDETNYWGFTTYVYKYEGKVPDTGAYYSCEVSFNSADVAPSITFSDVKYASNLEKSIKKFYDKKVKFDGVSYRLGDVCDVYYNRNGKTIDFFTYGD